MALLMLVLGVLSFAMMNVDIFPAINLPVVILIYNYPGLSAVDMERRIVLITERAYSLSVNDIQHIESESIEGLGPGTIENRGSATACRHAMHLHRIFSNCASNRRRTIPVHALALAVVFAMLTSPETGSRLTASSNNQPTCLEILISNG